MSIPPLVCSTPPPPDQCEDDKDPEDFDIQYHLSQDEDDEETFDFGNYATYNHFQSAKNKLDSSPVIPKIVNKVDDSQQGQKVDNDIDLGSNNISEVKLGVEEEVIEDLDLKLSADSLQHTDTPESKLYEDKTLSSSPDSDQNVQPLSESKVTTDGLNTEPLPSEEFVVEPPSLDIVDEPPSYVDEIIAAVDDLQLSSEAEPLPDLDIEATKQEIETKSIQNEDRIEEIPVDNDDDFGDFDDFQFASAADKTTTVIDSCDNPWDSNKDDGFDDFKASFDDASNMFSVPVEHSIEDSKSEVIVEDSDKPGDDDDDFGDFDGFKSSAAESEVAFNEPAIEQVAVINLPTDNEALLMESINKVVYAAFLNEMPEIEEELEDDLESVLGVAWNHLLQVDERQPYMVNWNNSQGQKTLLKALCIDSRNILFGPKWNYNMPKYAANLSVAPLQPQKQASSSIAPSEVLNPEKVPSKGGTWSDPFTTDGQDSCNSDSTTDNPVIEAGPTDLDVFEASTSSKPDKIYSSTLNVQPLRQINLPDTHIFTPTDSETPRSTTIHYDSSPPVLLTQTVIETSKSEPNFKSVTDTSSKPADNDDYWEFQDFKGTSSTLTTPTALPSTENGDIIKSSLNVSYGTQMLQPVKIEPIIPTLNWPDPGEVKETFDDFSDFVSSTTISNHPPIPIDPVQLESIPVNKTEVPGPSNTIVTSERIANTASDSFDDDFDTFQSALPSSSSMNFNLTSANKLSAVATSKPVLTPQVAPQSSTDFNYTFPKINNVKSETISIENISKSTDSSNQNQSSYFPNSFEVNKTPDFVAKNPPLQTTTIPVLGASLLQPTLASSSSASQTHQKSAQILQPLSLESYSQINWPNPGIDLQDLSRFNPVETLHSLKTDLSMNSQSKGASPVHSHKGVVNNQPDDDIWGEFVSSKPKPQHQAMPKKQTTFADDDEWTDFVSSPNVKPQNGLNTISFNVYTNSNVQKSNSNVKRNQVPLDIPTLNYITPKSNSQKTFNDRHFQNL